MKIDDIEIPDDVAAFIYTAIVTGGHLSILRPPDALVKAEQEKFVCEVKCLQYLANKIAWKKDSPIIVIMERLALAFENVKPPAKPIVPDAQNLPS